MPHLKKETREAEHHTLADTTHGRKARSFSVMDGIASVIGNRWTELF
jgi:regulator of extracellular matrix RemA (YlzA/DUF370 family)